MIQKIFLYSLLIGVSFLSCFNTPKKNISFQIKIETKKDTILSREVFYKKVENLINQTIENRENNKNYFKTNDSLNYYFSKFSPEELFEDNHFKAITGRLLEYEYLKVRNSGEYDPESFSVYNLTILLLASKNNRSEYFILKVINKGISDFVCIDSIVLALDKIPQMQNDSIHKICIDLVKRNKTGRCKW